MVVAVLGHRLLQIGDPGLERLIAGEVEEPREFPPRLIRPPWATRSEEARIPDREPRGAKSRDRANPLRCGHRDRSDGLARMGRRDELVHDDLDVQPSWEGRAAAPAQKQGGSSRREQLTAGDDRRGPGTTVAITTSTATPIDTAIRVQVLFLFGCEGRGWLTRRV